MANLFGKNRLREIAQQIETDAVLGFIAIAQTWHKDYHKGSLKADKETSREQAYNQDFFIKILGYQEKPAIPYSFEPKATTDKGQLPDAVISYTDTTRDIKNIAAVVELKGASIELDRPQRREGNFSPVQQGFKYKTQYRNCPFVIVSNFWEFRLYHDNLLDYELWTLDDLVNPDNDYLLFKTWFALLCHKNFTTSKGASKTENLLSDIRIEQEEIGKKFYKIYKTARLELLRDIYKRNDHIRTDIDTGVEKAQKIIDRIVFAAFAEDRGLLPDNTLNRVVKAADSSTFGGSLWNTFKSFFDAIDIGSEKLEIPNGYNGGLFKLDETLNNLQIGDDALRAVVSLGSYNFNEDLSVTILGHIFEQSISDLEEIKNKVNESQNLETLSQSRRKKDGIFYTPDYIVRYIVENSLGKYLREHEEKFKQEFGLKGDINDKNYEKREKQAYANYQDFLHGVKVVDPACGSGAFLVYVFDYLLAENKRVGDILGNTLFTSEEYVKSILQNNIYGVDLNEESVEITKLSLWLKSAQKGKKLTALDDNIKCGNSLIDDPEIAGAKAFDWHKEFAEIFKNGGFDVVVGNPPYVFTRENIESHEKEYFLHKYKNTQFKLNTYILFSERAYDLLKIKGRLGFIIPNNWLTLEFNSLFRKFILTETSDIVIVNCLDKVFQDASVDTSILLFMKQGDQKIIKAYELQNETFNEIATKQTSTFLDARDHILHFVDDTFSSINTKMDKASLPLSEIAEIKNGVQCYTVGEGIPTQTKDMKDKRVYHSLEKLDDSWFPYVDGVDMQRYFLDWSGQYVKYGSNLSRKRRWDLFNGERIIVRQIPAKPPYSILATLATDTCINDNNGMIVKTLSKDYDIRFILSILNSRLMSYWFIHTFGKMQRKIFPQFKVKELSHFPIPKTANKHSDQLKSYSSIMTGLAKQLHKKSSRFQNLILTEFNLGKWPTKLNKWWTLDFTDFVSALKLKLSLQQKDELLSLFQKYRVECSELDSKIKQTDQEIDRLVYKLYNLTPEEISLAENAK